MNRQHNDTPGRRIDRRTMSLIEKIEAGQLVYSPHRHRHVTPEEKRNFDYRSETDEQYPRVR